MLPGRILLPFKETSFKSNAELQMFSLLVVVVSENKNKKLIDILPFGPPHLSFGYIFHITMHTTQKFCF